MTEEKYEKLFLRYSEVRQELENMAKDYAILDIEKEVLEERIRKNLARKWDL